MKKSYSAPALICEEYIVDTDFATSAGTVNPDLLTIGCIITDIMQAKKGHIDNNQNCSGAMNTYGEITDTQGGIDICVQIP